MRLFLHVLGATIWVGGQITLAVLVPGARKLGADLPKALARRFNQIAWPAFALLIGSGVWNILAIGDAGSRYQTTLEVKLVVVAISGLSAWLHMMSKSKAGLAVFGSLTGASALGALFVGMMLGG